MAENFGVRLRERIREVGPLCVGVDPSSRLLAEWDRSDNVEGLEFFALAVLEAVSGTAAAIKPQVAFFERMGSGGLRVLERLIAEATDAELIVVADAKRGDVASTNEAYAQAWLGERSPLCVDALTLSPYLGLGALAPFFAAARATGRGVFVLAATSNEEGRTIQRARTASNETVEAHVLEAVAELNREEGELGSIGAVLGATRDAPDFDLAGLGGPFLVPGVGVQGAGVRDVERLFARCPTGTVLASVSRSILGAGPERRGLADAAKRWRDELLEVL